MFGVCGVWCGAENSDKDEECGVYAIFAVAVRVLVWHVLVHLWPSWPRSFCCCKYFFSLKVRFQLISVWLMVGVISN